MSGIITGYQKFMEKHQDPRTADWFLVGKTGTLITILTIYVYFCTKLGPRLMKNRKPFDLKQVIQAYNLFQIILSAYLLYMGISGWYMEKYNFWCQPVGTSRSPGAMKMATATWIYFINKLIELLDTVFFVLRKKYNQVSYLHIYHHTLMPICAFIGVTFVPGGHGILLGEINTFIHIIMYTYYFLSSLGPQMQKYLWWKKHLTALQMVQFCIVFFHNFQVLFRKCDYPKFLNFLLAAEALYFLYLFGTFYVNLYIKKKPQKTVVDQSTVSNGSVSGDMVNGKINGHIANGNGDTCNGKAYTNGHINGVINGDVMVNSSSNAKEKTN